jgi:predicted nucleic acid-binding protein
VILADTSVWIEHLHKGNDALAALMEVHEVLTHPFVVGELALGHIRARDIVVSQLQLLPQAVVVTPAEVLALIRQRRLFGAGIGYVDAHLLASVLVTEGAALWTHDRRLHAVARKLGVAYELAA